MLSFYKSRIFLDIEASIDAQGIIFDCSFLDKEKIKDFFPNLEIRKSLNIEDLMNNSYDIYLNTQQFESFIYAWYQHCDLEDIDIYKWLITYYTGILELQEKFQEHRPQEIFFRQNLQRELELRINILNEYALRYSYMDWEVLDFIRFNKPKLIPEISWIIYDFLQQKIKKYFFEVSKYRYYKELEENFRFNYDSIKYELNMLNYFRPKEIRKYTFLDLNINSIEKINYKNPRCLFYFYSPFPHERVRTNFKFIEESLIKYREESKKLFRKN